MMRRIVKLSCAAASIVLLAAAARGGWVVTTVDDVPEHLVAGRGVDVTFTIRQHGMSPLSDRSPTVTLRQGKTSTRATAAQTKLAGQYSARITPAAAGEAVIVVNPDFGNQTHTLLPITTVAANAPAPAALAPSQRGRQLFVAKGCTTCHTHAAAPTDQPEYLGEVGPNLTGKRFAVDYLKQFLADPSIKPSSDANKRMPNLNLKPAEIAALVAFINESKVAVTR
jgi:mono/diheme cytochrome c family protein